MNNRTIAQHLLDYARNLDDREANLFRVRAYRRAAETVLRLERPVEDILHEQGRSGLRDLPGIGRRLATTIDELVQTGEFPKTAIGDRPSAFGQKAARGGVRADAGQYPRTAGDDPIQPYALRSAVRSA